MPDDYQFDDEPTDDIASNTQFEFNKQASMRPSTSQSDMSARSERYDTLSGPDAWQQTQFYHPTNNNPPKTLKKSTSTKSKFQTAGLSSIRLQPLSETASYDEYDRQTQSAGEPSGYSTFSQTNEFRETSDVPSERSYSADAGYASSTLNGQYDYTSTQSGEQGEEVAVMSPRLQELVLQIEAQEQAARGIRKATNGQLAREKVVEDAYLRCLSDAERMAQHSDNIKQAGSDMISAWTRRDHAKMVKARNDGKELKATLDKQSEEARKRAAIEARERREAKMAFFLSENAGSFSLPLDGDAKNLSQDQRRERFCQDLGRQIQERAENKARAKAEKMAEERDYLDHIAVELDMQNAVERTSHLEKQQILLEAWERDAHIRNLKGLERNGAPAVHTYIQHNLPDVANLAKSRTGLGSMSIGFDSRSKR